MSDLRLKTLTIEPTNNLIVQSGNTHFTFTTPSTSALSASVVLNGGLSINHTTDASSHTAGGNLTINGGFGVLGKSFLGSDLVLESNTSQLRIFGSTVDRFFIDTVSNSQIRLAPDGVNNRAILDNNKLSLSATAISTGLSTGALLLSGAIAINMTANATSLGNGGSITSAGGISANGRAFIGGDTFIQGTSTGTGDISLLLLGPAPDFDDFNNTSYLKSISSSGTNSSSTLELYTHNSSTGSIGTLRMTIGNDTSNRGNGNIHISSNVDSTTPTIGSLTLAGGIGTLGKSYFKNQVIIGDTYVGNTGAHLILENLGGDTAGTDYDTKLVLHSKSNGESVLQFKNTLNTTSGTIELVFTGGEYLEFTLNQTTSLAKMSSNGTLQIFGTENTTSSTTGSLIVGGGIGIEKDLYVKGNIILPYSSFIKGQNSLVHQNILSTTLNTTVGSHSFSNQDTTILYTPGNSTGSSSSPIIGYNTQQVSIASQTLVDNTSTEAFLVRKTGDTGDVFTVDSTNGILKLNNTLDFTNNTNNFIQFNQAGVNTPTFTTRSTGTKIVLYNLIDSTNLDHAIGISSGTQWYSIPQATSSFQYRWYSGTTEIMELRGDGVLRLEGRQIIDSSNTQALLVRKNGDTGNIFTVDTTNAYTRHGYNTGTYQITLDKSDNTQAAFLYIDSTDIFQIRSNTIHLNSSGTEYAKFSTSGITFDAKQIIDITDTEAFLIRKNTDSGDVFFVDTTNSKVGIQSRNPDSHLSVRFISNSTSNIEPLLELQRDPLESSDSVYGDGSTTQVRNINSIQITNRTFKSGGPSKTDAILFYSNGIGDPLYLGLDYGYTSILSTVVSNSPTTGALLVAGGMGVVGDLYVGGNIVNGGGFALEATEDAINLTSGALVLGGGLTIQTSTNSVNLTNGGGLLVAGGASIGRDLYLGENLINTGTIQMKGTSNLNFLQFYDSTNTQRWVIGKDASHHLFINRYNTSGVLQEQSFGINVSTGKTTFSNTSNSTTINDASIIALGGISIAGSANATDVDNGGSLTIGGGVSIKKDTYIGGIVNLISTVNASNVSTGTLIIGGGLGLQKDLFVGGNTIITGDLTVNGTTTSISTSQTLLEDNIVIYHSGPAGTADSGFLIERYQIANNLGTGDVVNDPFSISQTFPSQSGTTTTTSILHAGASGTNDFYNGWWIKVTSGFSSNQVRKIVDYNGTTKIITIETAWTTQNPSNGDTFELFNKPYVGMIFNEIDNRFHLIGTNSDPGTGGTVNYTDEIDLYTRNLTLTGTKNSSSLISAGLMSSGGATFATTVEASSVTSGGAITTGGGVAIGKNLIVGTTLNVNGIGITPNSGDINSQVSFSGANNQAVADNVTGLAFNNVNTEAFDAYVLVKIIATSNLYAHFHLRGVQKASSWELVSTYVGDSTNVTFTITTGGQLQYTSGNYSGFTSLTIKFRAWTIQV